MKQATQDPSGREPPELCVFAPWPIFTVTVERVGGAEQAHDEVYFHAGGQGVWVARMIANLGGRATVVGPLGGESGQVIEALMAGEGLKLCPVRVRGANGGYVQDRRDGVRRTIADVAPAALDRHEVDDLYDSVLCEGLRCGTVVLTGVLRGPPLPNAAYRRLVHDLGSHGVEIVADLAGDLLKAIGGGLSILKISHEEAIEAGFAADDSRESLIAAVDALAAIAGNVVLSCAGAGAFALLDGQLLEVRAPELEALDPTGAGDSMTAALAVSRARGLGYREAMRLAAAAGALNVTRHGRGTGRLDHVAELAKRVEITEIHR